MRLGRLIAVGVCVAIVVVPLGAGGSTQRFATLLARHAPILILHPAERFRPVSVDGFLSDADLQRRTPSGWEKVAGPLPWGGRPLRLDLQPCRAADGVAASECYVQAQSAQGLAPVVYGAAQRTTTRIALQYWLWYPFNDYSPTIPAGEVWQVHEGDWESVTVILDPDGRPLQVGLSKHCAGTRREWNRAPKRGSRPLVHVALGSHANYFAAGTFAHDPRCWPRELRDVVRALRLVDHTGSGATVRPRLVPITATRPTWMTFAGTWGEDGYVHFANNDPIAYDGSPRGPAARQQWRRPVAEVLRWPRG